MVTLTLEEFTETTKQNLQDEKFSFFKTRDTSENERVYVVIRDGPIFVNRYIIRNYFHGMLACEFSCVPLDETINTMWQLSPHEWQVG